MIKRFKEWVSSHKRLTILFGILFILVVFFVIFLLFGQKYIGSPIGKINLPNIENLFSKDDEEIPAEEDSPSEEIDTIKDLELDFLGSPVLVSKQFNLSKPGEDGKDIDDEIKGVYKTADVLRGTYKGESLKDCEVFILKYPSLLMEARIISCDNKKIYVIGTYAFEYGSPIDVPEENVVQVLSDSENDLNSFFNNQSLPEFGKTIVSDSGNSFEVRSLTFEVYEKGELTEIDKIDGLPVYNIASGGKGESLIASPEGFYQILVVSPGIVSINGEYNEPQVTIKLNEGGTFSAIYDYISIGGCFNNYIEVADVKLASLTKIGVGINGDSIYQDTDRNAAYLKKMYNEDYAIKDGVHKWNNLSDDDTTPYAYDKYLENYPVIYWVDPFDRIIKFANRNFISTGGCAKPAIYLYSEKAIDLNVKVIPNGHLTFTSPKYPVNGWNVTASVNGSVQYQNEIYPYLWWESTSYGYVTPENGWVIKKETAEEKIGGILSDYGLNQTEINDFLTYWIPKIERENSEYIFVTFLVNDQVNQIAKLKFSIEPDNSLRLFMIYKPLDEYEKVTPLKTEKLLRNGLTVIEWGGAKY
ncbi:MAG TPA: hypothetical protein PKI16_02880 [Candidatus Dojkabacteria bacterium]|nr:hypothetical protein [Candidatus Dojkabacteria bacterium]